MQKFVIILRVMKHILRNYAFKWGGFGLSIRIRKRAKTPHISN